MADLKISALPASTTPLAGTEILPIVQSATTRQVSVANLTAGRAVSALSLTSTNDATINGITVGRGGGSVSLNTAVGASALAATSTGDGNAAFGASALASNLAGTGNTATGFTSLRDNTSGNYNVASGYLALATNLSGNNNVGIGYSVLSTGTATSSNTAIGYEALKVASGSTNTAIGYQSGVAMTTGTKNVILGSYSGNTGTLDIRISNNNIVLSDGDGNVRAWWDNANARFYGTLLATGITNSALTSGRVTYAGASGLLTDSANLLYSGTDLTVYGLTVGRGPGASVENTTVGSAAFSSNSSGTQNVAVGRLAMQQSTSSSFSVAVGNAALQTLSTGSNNTAVGASALNATLTASNNTAVGYQAGYTNSTGAKNVFIGQQAGKVSTGNFNTIIGNEAGLALDTGTCNTFVGAYNNTVGGSGELVTSGSKNTILGVFTGNQGGLDIRTASNYIVLSDGDGNPLISTNSTRSVALNGAVPQTGTGITFPATENLSSNANTLDDYEEGTWTPSQGAGLTVVGTFSSSGTYTKIGRVVNLRGSVTGSTTVALAASDTVICGNIPFTPIGSVADRNIGGMTNNTNNASGAVSALGSFTTIYNIGTIAATTDIHFSVTYFA